MKKITLIAGALLAVSSLMAEPAQVRTTTHQTSVKTSVFEQSVLQQPLAKDNTRAIRRMPAQTTAISDYTFTQIDLTDGEFTWKGTPEASGTYYYYIEVYNSDINSVAWGGWKTSVFGSEGSYSFNLYSLLNYGYTSDAYEASTATAGSGSNAYNYLIPGTYILWIEGLASDGRTTTEEAVYFPITINSYDITNLQAQANDEKNKVTVTWETPENAPADAWTRIYVAQGTSVIYNNYSTKEAVSSPFEFNVEDGKTYDIVVTLLSADGFAWGTNAETSITIGTNKAAPTALKAEVIEEYGDTVTLSWSAEEPAAYYWIYVYNEDGEIVGSTYTENSTGITLGFAPGTYTWEVVAMEREENSLYPMSEYVEGPDFTTEDIIAPVIEKVEVSTTATTATFTITVHDTYCATEDIDVTFMDQYYNEAGYAEYDADNDVFSLTIDKILDTPLAAGQTYELSVFAADADYNANWMSPYKVEFTMKEQDPTGLKNLGIAGIRYENSIIVNTTGETLRVYNANGALVAESTRNIDTSNFGAGLYVIYSQDSTLKITK